MVFELILQMSTSPFVSRAAETCAILTSIAHVYPRAGDQYTDMVMLLYMYANMACILYPICRQRGGRDSQYVLSQMAT